MTDRIKHLRHLLTLYYDGMSTPEQTREIITIFNECPSLPPDLLAERRIFSLSEQLAASLSTPSDSLSRIIDDTIESCAAAQRRRSRYKILSWLSVAGIAASIALFLLIPGAPESPDPVAPKVHAHTPALPHHAQPNPSPENQPAEHLPADPPADDLIASTPAKPSSRHAEASPKATQRSPEADPREVAQKLDDIFMLIDAKMQFTARTSEATISTINEATDEATQKVNYILSKCS